MLALALFYRFIAGKFQSTRGSTFGILLNECFELTVEIWRLKWSISMHFVLEERQKLTLSFRSDFLVFARASLGLLVQLMALAMFEIALEIKYCCHYLLNTHRKLPLSMWRKRPKITVTSFYILSIKLQLFIRTFFADASKIFSPSKIILNLVFATRKS